jgi:hypothetical protein
LEEYDICAITIPKILKSWVNNLPVMVNAMMKKRDGTCYKVCSKHHGHLTGTYSRSELAYWKKYTIEIVKIDQSNDRFEKKLS